MLSPADMFDFRDTKFKIGAIYPLEKQKFMEDMLRAKAAEHGIDIDIARAPGETQYVFTLDEALNYFKSLKEIQDMALAEKAGGA